MTNPSGLDLCLHIVPADYTFRLPKLHLCIKGGKQVCVSVNVDASVNVIVCVMSTSVFMPVSVLMSVSCQC